MLSTHEAAREHAWTAPAPLTDIAVVPKTGCCLAEQDSQYMQTLTAWQRPGHAFSIADKHYHILPTIDRVNAQRMILGVSFHLTRPCQHQPWGG